MQFFRLISVIEGISLLVLLFVAMPLRSYADMPLAVTYAGWVHGVLFIVYGATSLFASHLSGWPVWKWLLVLFLGVVPFGFLYVDHLIRREISNASAARTA